MTKPTGNASNDRILGCMFIKSLGLSLLFVVLLAVSATSQETNCIRPTPELYDEFTISSPAALKGKLMEFQTRFRDEAPQMKAQLFVYGGRYSRVSEIIDLVSQIQKSLNITPSDYNSRVLVSDGGYREKPTVEIFLRPLDCTGWPGSSSDIRPEEVQFDEFPPETTKRMDVSKIFNLSSVFSEAVCGAAARAVRACDEKSEVDVFIIVDIKGFVRFSKAVDGHPLNRRAAEEAVKRWQFKSLFVDGRQFNFSGIVNVKFQIPNIEIDY